MSMISWVLTPSIWLHSYLLSVVNRIPIGIGPIPLPYGRRKREGKKTWRRATGAGRSARRPVERPHSIWNVGLNAMSVWLGLGLTSSVGTSHCIFATMYLVSPFTLLPTPKPYHYIIAPCFELSICTALIMITYYLHIITLIVCFLYNKAS